MTHCLAQSALYRLQALADMPNLGWRLELLEVASGFIKHGAGWKIHSSIGDFPNETSIYRGFSIAMFDATRWYSNHQTNGKRVGFTRFDHSKCGFLNDLY